MIVGVRVGEDVGHLLPLRELLHPAPEDGLEAYPVSPAVNNVRSEGPGLLDPLTRWSAPR